MRDARCRALLHGRIDVCPNTEMNEQCVISPLGARDVVRQRRRDSVRPGADVRRPATIVAVGDRRKLPRGDHRRRPSPSARDGKGRCGLLMLLSVGVHPSTTAAAAADAATRDILSPQATQ